ncbi:MAG: response regulator transcription factor [Bacteroidales bacterium]|jgi:DNA-binding NarL/FixJ family response regulator|nr:response regulator transcription factor [Bacteroidales bacterium]
MIVDNEEAFRKGLKTILLNIGDVDIVAEASNGKEFLEQLDCCEADLVFMDVKMPVMDGLEATRRAKATYPELSIIAFSSYDTQYYGERMMNAGACAYLSKSADNYDMLADIISKLKTGNFSGVNNH